MTWGISSYNTTPASNTNVNGINIGELCNASGINDAIRQIMADIATWFATGLLAAANNLSDLSNAATARTNLGLKSGATTNITVNSSAPSGGSDGDIWIQ
jgi:hypothetical protein